MDENKAIQHFERGGHPIPRHVDSVSVAYPGLGYIAQTRVRYTASVAKMTLSRVPYPKGVTLRVRNPITKLTLSVHSSA